mgnify:CR=1 FL=1
MEDLVQQIVTELKNINNRFDRLEKGQQDLVNGQKSLEEGQLRLEERQKSLEQGQQRLEERQQILEQGQQRLEERQQILEQGQQRLEERQQILEQGQQRLEETINNLGTEMRSHFKHIEKKLDQQHTTFEVVAEEIKNIKIDITYLSEKTGRHDTEINNLSKRIQS